MIKPCEHCEKADGRSDYFKCDKPCNRAKQCFKMDSDLIDILAGISPKFLKELKELKKE